jgi:hypothetical protein
MNKLVVYDQAKLASRSRAGEKEVGFLKTASIVA